MQLTNLLAGNGADIAYSAIVKQTPWRTIYNVGNRAIDVSASEMDAWTAEERVALTRTIFAGAATGFQYCFDQFSLSEHMGSKGAISEDLRGIWSLFTSEEFIQLMRSATGDAEIAFSDVMLSRYRPGHFLTTHDDKLASLNRRHAFVLSLTPRWQVDWGGLLVFRDFQNNISVGYTPAFNVLSIFRVPQDHAVTLVTPFAPFPRISVTGWLHGA